jgi:hypothetical protein
MHMTCILEHVIQDSAGIHHLQKLSDAGLTHVHLLPSFQFGGVDDIKSNWKCVGKEFCFLYITRTKHQVSKVNGNTML